MAYTREQYLEVALDLIENYWDGLPFKEKKYSGFLKDYERKVFYNFSCIKALSYDQIYFWNTSDLAKFYIDIKQFHDIGEWIARLGASNNILLIDEFDPSLKIQQLKYLEQNGTDYFGIINHRDKWFVITCGPKC